jgi:hypothetical protein
MKKCSPSLAIKETQIKSRVKFHLTPVRITIIKNTTTNRCWWGYREKGTLVHCWWECKLLQPLWKKIWRLLNKLNVDLPYDPAIPLLGMYPKNVTQVTPESPAHPCLLQHYSNSQVMETAKMPHYWRMDLENVVFTNNGILLSYKEEWNLIILK